MHLFDPIFFPSLFFFRQLMQEIRGLFGRMTRDNEEEEAGREDVTSSFSERNFFFFFPTSYNIRLPTAETL